MPNLFGHAHTFNKCIVSYGYVHVTLLFAAAYGNLSKLAMYNLINEMSSTQESRLQGQLRRVGHGPPKN